VELTLAPSTDVLVEVRVPPDLRYSPLAVEAQAQDALPPDAGPTFEAVDWPALRPIPAVEGQPHSDGLRTFRLRLGPGPYELRAEGPLFEIEPATIEIGAEGGERRVELTARS
jgi:hypothetical protein